MLLNAKLPIGLGSPGVNIYAWLARLTTLQNDAVELAASAVNSFCSPRALGGTVPPSQFCELDVSIIVLRGRPSN
jgi:hypothetical protein